MNERARPKLGDLTTPYRGLTRRRVTPTISRVVCRAAATHSCPTGTNSRRCASPSLAPHSACPLPLAAAASEPARCAARTEERERRTNARSTPSATSADTTMVPNRTLACPRGDEKSRTEKLIPHPSEASDDNHAAD